MRFLHEATCTNPKCNTQVDYNHEETLASFRATLRDPALTDTWVTIQEARTIWGHRIKAGTLSKWVTRGHIRRRDTHYNLGDINHRLIYTVQ